MSREETSTQDSTETCKRHCSGAYVVQHHPDLNTYTLSVVTEQGTTPPSLLKDVQDLRRAILQNTTQVEVSHVIFSLDQESDNIMRFKILTILLVYIQANVGY